MTALVMAAGRLRLPRVPALPRVHAATVRRLLVTGLLAAGLALVARPGWGLVLAGVLLGWLRLL